MKQDFQLCAILSWPRDPGDQEITLTPMLDLLRKIMISIFKMCPALT
jgi:hypothetical protein